MTLWSCGCDAVGADSGLTHAGGQGRTADRMVTARIGFL